MILTYEERVEAWSSPPVDDVGYISSTELYGMSADELRAVIALAEKNRYGGWRNWENRWRDFLGLDETRDKSVLDYGCGIGIEALQYARGGNDIVIADISKDNVRLALRVLRLEGFEAGAFQITPKSLVNGLFGKFDVIHCAGVLHHIPIPELVMEEFANALEDDGEVRLMVYSDQAWRIACGTEPPTIVVHDPNFTTYWQHWDAVGGYADWYDRERLQERFGSWFEVKEVRDLTEHGEYLGAILVKR